MYIMLYSAPQRYKIFCTLLLPSGDTVLSEKIVVASLGYGLATFFDSAPLYHRVITDFFHTVQTKKKAHKIDQYYYSYRCGFYR